ncbi:MAG: stage III sporulation AC/AD family protein [Clostridia bacterium]|nr:stage III sporulation AC/AD family protein [Clostridia bacterium]
MKICEESFPKFKPLLLCQIGIVFFLLFSKTLSPLLGKIASFGSESEVPELFQLLYKGLGICILTAISTSFCRDLGEEKIAEKLELCGKGSLLFLSLPVLEYLLTLIGEILS